MPWLATYDHDQSAPTPGFAAQFSAYSALCSAQKEPRPMGLRVRCVGSPLQSDFPRPPKSHHLDRLELVHGRSDHHRRCGFLAA